MAELPILPLNVFSLISDTRHMTSEEFGAYCRILFTMWIHGGRLEDNAKQLRLVAGVHPVRWRNIENAVMKPFTREGGLISQKRLTDTLLKVRETRRGRAALGAMGGRAMALKSASFVVLNGGRNPLR